MAGKGKVLDFTDVKDGGQYQPRHIPEGDYTARVTAVTEQKSKSDDEEMWVFTIVLDDRPSGKYPYYCKLTTEQLWKLRNLMIAGGVSVPKQRMKVDPNKLIGRAIGVAMVDDEYNGQMKSVVDSVFPVDDAGEATKSTKSKKAQDIEDEDVEEDEEEDDTPPPPKKGKKRKPEPEPEPEEDDEEDDEEEDEDDEEEPPPPPKKAKKGAAKKAPAKKAKPAPVEDDEDDEDDDELDVDDDDL